MGSNLRLALSAGTISGGIAAAFLIPRHDLVVAVGLAVLIGTGVGLLAMFGLKAARRTPSR